MIACKTNKVHNGFKNVKPIFLLFTSIFVYFFSAHASSQTAFVIDKDGFPMEVLVSSAIDMCADTPVGVPIDSMGCAASQLDIDFDGVSEAEDICANTAVGSVVNEIGCTEADMIFLNSQDEDSDGVPDYLDQCHGTTAGQIPEIDGDGCHRDQRDADGDGIADYLDAYPLQHNSMCPAN